MKQWQREAMAQAAAPTRPAYRYKATVDRVVDGDTMIFDVDCGFTVHVKAMVRLQGWDCPERNTPDGPRATELSRSLLAAAGTIIIETEKDTQSFARWVARIWIDGKDLGQVLSLAGLAVKII